MRPRVNRRNEGIERLLLVQASNQYSQHLADWVHIFFPCSPSASVLPPPKLIPSIRPHFPRFTLRGYQTGMYFRQMPANTNLAYFEARWYWPSKMRASALGDTIPPIYTLFSGNTYRIHILFRKFSSFHGDAWVTCLVRVSYLIWVKRGIVVTLMCLSGQRRENPCVSWMKVFLLQRHKLTLSFNATQPLFTNVCPQYFSANCTNVSPVLTSCGHQWRRGHTGGGWDVLVRVEQFTERVVLSAYKHGCM